MAMRRARPRREFFECPHCGADVAIGSKVCKECGSDASTGWQSGEEIDYQSLDLPEGYSADPEHPGGPLPTHRSWWFVAAAIVSVLAVLLWSLLR